MVLVIAMIVFSTSQSNSLLAFKLLVGISVIVGSLLSIMFLLTVKEVGLTQFCLDNKKEFMK